MDPVRPHGRHHALSPFGLGLRGLALAILALADAGPLAAQATQIIELGAAYLAAPHDLDRVDHRRIERKHALHPFAIGDFPHGKILVQAASGAADADTLIGLDASALALDHLDVHDQRVARLKIGDFLAD